MQKRLQLLLTTLGCLVLFFTSRNISAQKTLWQIGKADKSDAEFALAPSGYPHFLEKDFGWEDGYFLIGKSNPETDWPYALPGPQDSWGGTAPNAGLHAPELNILFGIDKATEHGQYVLIIDLLDMSAEKPPFFKVMINDRSWEFQLPKGSGDSTLKGGQTNYPGHEIKIPIPINLIRNGGNDIKLQSLWGSWIVFDQIRLEGPADTKISVSQNAFIRSVDAANYQTKVDGKSVQPLLIDVQHISGEPLLEAFVDGKKIFQKRIESGQYIFEAPMPAVTTAKESRYEIKSDNQLLQSGTINRSPQKEITPADYVDTKIGTAHSRWMIAPGPWMPFSMVKISPDNQNAGWQAGYDPIFESVGGFSHIHEWTMSGLSMLPVNGPLITEIGDQIHPDKGYRSRIDKNTEEAPLGYYKVHLTKYDITAELTATTRCSFQRYTFPKEKV